MTNAATCAAFAPICPSTRDTLSDGTARQILIHNRTGATLCGWQPSACRAPGH